MFNYDNLDNKESLRVINDIMWLNVLIARLGEQLVSGDVYPFSAAGKRAKQFGFDHPDMLEVFYIDDPEAPNYLDLVLEYDHDGNNISVAQTYSDMMRNLDVRAEVSENVMDDGHVTLHVFPKGHVDLDDLDNDMFSLDPTDAAYSFC